SLHHHATPPSDNPDTLLPFYTPHFTTSHFFFFNDTATTEIYTLSLHDALPIFGVKIFSRKGIEKDDRAKAIEAEELEMMEKNLQDEIRILHDEVKKRVMGMLQGQTLRSDLFDEYGRERVMKKGTVLNAELLLEMPYET